MRTILFLLITLFVSTTSAQNGYYEYGKFLEGSTVHLFGDNVNVRSDASVKSSVISKLPIGHPVTIVKCSDIEFSVNNLNAHWYEVSFDFAGKKQKGYIWGGFLALTQQFLGNNKSESLIFGLTDRIEGFASGQVKLIKNGKIVSTLSVTPKDMPLERSVYNYSVSSTLTNNKGFDKVKNFLVISFTFGACGYPNGEAYIAYTGETLLLACETTKISEAGVFHNSEKAVFPADKDGVQGKIIIISEEAEFDEEKNDYKTPKIEKKIYTFDGQKFIPPPAK